MSEMNNPLPVTKEESLLEYQVRLEKVKRMREEGIEPWPEYKKPTETCESALKLYDEVGGEDQECSLVGRLILMREHGKTIFANILDGSGKIQIYIKKDLLGDAAFDKFKKYFDLGDIIWCEGKLFRTKMGEITLKVEKLEMLCKCLHPLPEKFHGLTDVEQRYRQRYLDLISNPENREKFKKRSAIVQSIRNDLLDQGFLEVETPMLHPIPGGALARPFVTHHNTYDMDLYLRIAPELYLKKLVVGGFERVFEINRNFRNEGISTRHNPEFTMIEFYMANGDYKVGMEVTEFLLQRVAKENFSSTTIPFKDTEISFEAPFKRLTMVDSLIEVAHLSHKDIEVENIDETLKKHHIVSLKENLTYGEKIFELFERLVESKLIQPTFIIKHPLEVSPLAKRDPKDPFSVARFELFVGGIELANGYTELNDPIDQAQRFKKMAEAKETADYEAAHFYDEDFIKALEYGLPPTVGVGIGIDRFVMLLTDTASIKDVILFPALKPVKEE